LNIERLRVADLIVHVTQTFVTLVLKPLAVVTVVAQVAVIRSNRIGELHFWSILSRHLVQFGAGIRLLNRIGIYLLSIWHGKGCWYCFGMTQLMPVKCSCWSGFGILRPPPTTPNGECHHCKDSHGACGADSDANPRSKREASW
jgi:hypothetical protein